MSITKTDARGIVEGIVPAIKEYVESGTTILAKRILTLEARNAELERQAVGMAADVAVLEAKVRHLEAGLAEREVLP